MDLYEPPEDGFEVLRVDVDLKNQEDTSTGPFAYTTVYFADTQTEQGDPGRTLRTHTADRFHRFVGFRSEDDVEPGDVASPITKLKRDIWCHKEVVAWTPATKGIVKELRNLDEYSRRSNSSKSAYFAALLASLDQLWD